MNRKLEEICGVVYNQRRNTSKIFWKKIEKDARILILTSTVSDHEKNLLWFIVKLATCTLQYIGIFKKFQRKQFRIAWNDLEQVEIELSQLSKNLFLISLSEHIDLFSRLISQLQSTYPYRYFISPEMKIIDWKCSICSKKSMPMKPCGHQIGKVYPGQLCLRIITDAKILGMSIVTDPVQKFSVLIPKEDNTDYSVTEFVIRHLDDPFEDWFGEWMYATHSHSNFTHLDRNELCPCDSKLKYKECCLKKSGVRLPHFQFEIVGQPFPKIEIILK